MLAWPQSFKNCKLYQAIRIEQTLLVRSICFILLMLINCVALNFSYRGYYSRRWEHDFYARKKYLQYVETKNEEVRRNLDEHNRGIAQEE